ncbi:hypothetical protein ACS0TY_032805 [Phlomoides rotata]
MEVVVYLMLLIYLVHLAFLFPSSTQADNGGQLGAILDCSSRAGKEEGVAMELAIRDINKNLTLWTKCSRHGPLHAAQAARYLVNRRGVKGIIAPNSWDESSAIAEVGHQLNVPIVSLYDSTPVWATTRWPSFVQASPSTCRQMKAVASIVNSWGWRRVNVIYEDADFASSDILNHLYGALHDADVEFSALVPLSSSSHTLQEEMEKLRSGQCRVFVVHTSLGLAERIFGKAKEMKMMEEEYVWITTHSVTSMIHAVNASVISSMEGVVGVARYFPDVREDFHKKFTANFRQKYPEEKNDDPGMSALQAYDAARAVGSALNVDAQKMMEAIEKTNFQGLSGEIRFDDRKLAPANRFRIINVVGKSYRELGFWSEGLGFSTVMEDAHNSSMIILGHVFWPGGGPWSAPRGWGLETIPKPLRIGVPNGSLLEKFIKVEYDPITKQPNFSGFSIQVFTKTVAKLKYDLPHEFVALQGSYTEMVKKVQNKELDAAVGDINIISSRYEYVEFTHAYTESGLCMVVPIERRSSRAWLFMKPFTKGLWLLTILINVYNGFVIWSIEKHHCSDPKAPILAQIASLIWLAFATLFSWHGGRLHSDLSKMATVVWLFVALIITQSYTASLTSMLTLQNIEPKISSLETLKAQHAYVGYNKRSFVKDYLVTALHFNPDYIKNFTTAEDYSEAFKSGEIAAAFLEAPDAKLFVAKYCNTFTIAGPTYKVGGYGFAFPKGSVLLHDIDEALLSVFESGELKELEDSLMASQTCVDSQPQNDPASLSPQGFFVPFIFTGGTSTVALAIYYFRTRLNADSMPQHKGIWLLISLVLLKWRNHRNRFSRKVSDIDTPTDSPNV